MRLHVSFFLDSGSDTMLSPEQIHASLRAASDARTSFHMAVPSTHKAPSVSPLDDTRRHAEDVWVHRRPRSASGGQYRLAGDRNGINKRTVRMQR